MKEDASILCDWVSRLNEGSQIGDWTFVHSDLILLCGGRQFQVALLAKI